MLQAVEESIAEQQQVLTLMSERGDELKDSLQTLFPRKPVDIVRTELDMVYIAHSCMSCTAKVIHTRKQSNFLDPRCIIIIMSAINDSLVEFGC